MKIVIPEKIVEIPDGDRCVSWDPKESRASKDFQCQFFDSNIQYISQSDSVRAGFGYDAHASNIYSCRLYNTGIYRYEYGVGAFKCEQCKAQEAV